MTLRVEIVADAREFSQAIADVVSGDPAGYTVLAAVLADVMTGDRHQPGALWFMVRDGQRPVGAAMRTPPHPLYLGPMPPQAPPLVADAAAAAMGADGRLPGISGEAEAVRSAAARWQWLVPDVSVAGTVHERLHRLGTLVVPDVPGSPRTATADDLPLLARWFEAFAGDVGHSAVDLEAGLRLRIDRGHLWVWTVDGDPVAMAGHTPNVAGVARVGPVYTPPGRRRHGYGAAVTAAASASAQALGTDEVVLFTDLANPTSNKIYAEIGYRGVRDYLEVMLEV